MQQNTQSTPTKAEFENQQIGNRNVSTIKFKNKYRILSHRKPNWDYSGNGYYFITIVTKNRKCVLGNIDVTPVETHGPP